MRVVMRSVRQQNGVSILMALMVVLVVSSVIAGVAVTTHYTVRRGGMITHLNQAQAYNRGALVFAQKVLKTDAFQNNHDGLNEMWAQQLPAFPVEGGQVTGRIHELNSRFNLANLQLEDTFEQGVFERLWRLLGGERKTGDNVLELAKSQRYFSVIGLFTAAGVSEAELAKFAPYFVYLPTNASQLNMNCVSPEVLAAYLSLHTAQAQQLLKPLQKQPLSSKNDLLAFAKQQQIYHIGTSALDPTSASVIELRFGVKSRYFQVVGETTIGAVKSVSVTTIDRSGQQISILNQRLSKLPTE